VVTAAGADRATSADADAVRAAERALYDAQIAGDVTALRPMLADDLVYIHSTGVAETRDEYLAGVTARLYEYGTIESRVARLRVHGDAALQTGVVDMTVAAHGASKTMIHLLFCLVWSRQSGHWRLSYRQATRMPG
jgi:ketosteroid isomerase-like protein